MKKIIALLLVIIMISALASCENGTDATTTAEQTTTAPAATTPGTTESPAESSSTVNTTTAPEPAVVTTIDADGWNAMLQSENFSNVSVIFAETENFGESFEWIPLLMEYDGEWTRYGSLDDWDYGEFQEEVSETYTVKTTEAAPGPDFFTNEAVTETVAELKDTYANFTYNSQTKRYEGTLYGADAWVEVANGKLKAMHITFSITEASHLEFFDYGTTNVDAPTE